MLELFAHDAEAFRELSAIFTALVFTTNSCAISQDRATPSQRDESSGIGHGRISEAARIPVFQRSTSSRKRIGPLTPCAKNSSTSTNISSSGGSRHMKTVERIIGFKPGTADHQASPFSRKWWTCRFTPN